MMRALVLILGLASFSAFSQNMEGKVVIEYNASWNTSNGYKNLGRLNGAKLYRVNLEKNPSVKDKYNIKSVPCIILFRDGKEVWRWEAGLDMQVHTHYLEIQDAINRF